MREALDREACMHRSMKELRIELSAIKVELEAVKGSFKTCLTAPSSSLKSSRSFSPSKVGRQDSYRTAAPALSSNRTAASALYSDARDATCDCTNSVTGTQVRIRETTVEGQSVHMDGRPALDAQPAPGQRQSKASKPCIGARATRESDLRTSKMNLGNLCQRSHPSASVL